MFDEDKEVITYKTNQEAISKANYLLQNPNIAKEVGLAGQKKPYQNLLLIRKKDLYFHFNTLLN